MTDVWFTRDPTLTLALGDVPIPVEIQGLPNAKGFGNVRDLHQAMALDTSGRLKAMVEEFVLETDPQARRELLPQLMFQWTGGKNAHMDDGYYNGWVKAGQYFNTTGITQMQDTVLEAFIGTEKFFNNTGAGQQLLVRYQQLEDIVFYQLMSQTHLKKYYELVDFSFDEATQSWRGDYSLAATVIAIQASLDIDGTSELLNDFLHTVRGMNTQITENLDSIRQDFEAIIKDNWENQGIRTLATGLSEYFLGSDDGGETLNASQLGDQYTGIIFGGGADRIDGGLSSWDIQNVA